MLKLTNIHKSYTTGDTRVEALRSVSLQFRRNEFVSILGPSGCGKTTLLNIIGGLDRYDDGELAINDTPTARYKDSDWDAYRNHSVGFVFQSYNLIPHQTVLSNVELALTLSGVPKAERRRRAKEALEMVGLGDQLKKKPNQMSGGQMQRVAIARALVNDPEILLADEPTGALDSETSVQIMEILKEISKDRLIIMVTHNPDLADRYSNRIIRLLDGQVVGDSNPYNGEDTVKTMSTEQTKKRKKHPSMSFGTALSLSLNNLLTKKGRTVLTSFAGSIGIIGIALILALSNGIKLFINDVQEDTLSTYPISLLHEEQDYSALFSAMTEVREELNREPEDGKIYVNETMDAMMSAMNSTTINNLTGFKTYLEAHYDEIKDSLSALQYTYNVDMNIFSSDGKTQINPTTVFENMGDSMSSMMSMMPSSAFSTQFNVFGEMIDNPDLLASQYDVLAGAWPTEWNEVVLVVDEHNSLSSMVMYMLGLEDQSELKEQFEKLMKGEKIEKEYKDYTFDDFMSMTFRIVPNSAYFYDSGKTYTVDGKTYPIWNDVRNDDDYDAAAFAAQNGLVVKIAAIVRPAEGAMAGSINNTIGYRYDLVRKLLEVGDNSALTAQQKACPDTDIFTGLPFKAVEYTQDNIEEFLATMTAEEQGMLTAMLSAQMGAPLNPSMLPTVLAQMDAESYATLVEYFKKTTEATYDDNLFKMGYVSEDNPASINLYAKDFASKDTIAAFIEQYNASVEEADEITYVDIVGLMMSSVTLIINIISYVLIAFVSISLVVSSIMIGIITYISVLERTKEIGILRSIGASKHDVSMVFNAETLIVGLVAGLFGILATVVLIIPTNYIIQAASGVSEVGAVLPVAAAFILVAISMALTLIAGLIPSRVAAKKDPVVALRME